jgi:CheY-like chemotaxis protein
MRVMVADNDPEALDLVVLDLRLEGHTVVGVTSGSEVLSRIEDFGPDVLILDYRMPPGPSGLDVAQSVRAKWPHVHLILYTNYQDSAIGRRANTLQVTFLPKGNLRVLRALVCSRSWRQPAQGDTDATPPAAASRQSSHEPHEYA